jgi:hypothetical protein
MASEVRPTGFRPGTATAVRYGGVLQISDTADVKEIQQLPPWVWWTKTTNLSPGWRRAASGDRGDADRGRADQPEVVSTDAPGMAKRGNWQAPQERGGEDSAIAEG